MLCDGVQKPQKLRMSVITLRAVEPLLSTPLPGLVYGHSWFHLVCSAGNNCNPNTRAAGESA
jgi:hypothetical protein